MRKSIYNMVKDAVRRLLPFYLITLSLFHFFTFSLLMSSCRDEHLIVYAEDEDTGKETVVSDIIGM